MIATPSLPRPVAQRLKRTFGLFASSGLSIMAALAACGAPEEESTTQDILPFNGQGPNGATAGNGTGGSAGSGNTIANAPVAAYCVAGQARCNGGRLLETCNALGSAFNASTCEAGTACLAGACRPLNCRAGESLCLGNEIHLCSPDGKSSTLSRTCDTGSACDASTRACRPMLCEPLVASCNGNTATRCDATGFEYNAGVNTACAAGQRCNLGVCLNPEQVAPNPLNPTPATPGPNPVNPVPTPITPTPDPMQVAQAPTLLCTPGQVTCDGANTIATCSADGFDAAITRCPNGTTCGGAGSCNPVACNAQGLTSVNGGQGTVYWFGQGTVNYGNIACGYGIQPGNLGNGQGDAVTGIANPTMFVAINTTNYRGSASCGACVEMNYQGRTVNATVVDECPIGSNPTCTAGHLDLSRGAWNALTNNAGGTEISGVNWRFVPCTTQANVTIELKEPSNAYWNQFLVRGHRFPIQKAEVELDNGTWVQASRTQYNFFEPPEGVMGTYRVRVTDVNGGVIEEQLELEAGPQGGNAQFACQ
jgi:expansin